MSNRGIPTAFDESPTTAPSKVPELLAATMAFADDEATDPDVCVVETAPPEAPGDAAAAALGAMFDEMRARGVPLSIAQACLARGMDRLKKG